MRAILVSFRLDMARITMSSASGFVPFLLPLLFAVALPIGMAMYIVQEEKLIQSR